MRPDLGAADYPVTIVRTQGVSRWRSYERGCMGSAVSAIIRREAFMGPACYTPDAISSSGSPFTPGHVLYPSALLAVFAVLYWSLRLRLAVYSSGLLIRPMG